RQPTTDDRRPTTDQSEDRGSRMEDRFSEVSTEISSSFNPRFSSHGGWFSVVVCCGWRRRDWRPIVKMDSVANGRGCVRGWARLYAPWPVCDRRVAAVCRRRRLGAHPLTRRSITFHISRFTFYTSDHPGRLLRCGPHAAALPARSIRALRA